MPKLLASMALAALALTLLAIMLTKGRNLDPARVPPVGDEASGLPESEHVLLGSEEELSVLVRRRYSANERQEFTDKSLHRALGLKDGTFDFLEVIVTNAGKSEIAAEPEGLVLLDSEGKTIPTYGLRSLAASTPAGRVLLDFHAPLKEPLAPSSQRRVLFAVESTLDFEAVSAGTYLGVRLLARVSKTEQLEALLEVAHPDPKKLRALNDSPVPGAGRMTVERNK